MLWPNSSSPTTKSAWGKTLSPRASSVLRSSLGKSQILTGRRSLPRDIIAARSQKYEQRGGGGGGGGGSDHGHDTEAPVSPMCVKGVGGRDICRESTSECFTRDVTAQ